MEEIARMVITVIITILLMAGIALAAFGYMSGYICAGVGIALAAFCYSFGAFDDY